MGSKGRTGASWRGAAVLAAVLLLTGVLTWSAQAADATVTSDDVGWVDQADATGTHCGTNTQVSNASNAQKKSSFQFTTVTPNPGSTNLSSLVLRIWATVTLNDSSTVLTVYDRNVSGPDGCNLTWNSFSYGNQLGSRTGAVTKNSWVEVTLNTNLGDVPENGRTGLVVTSNKSTTLKFQTDIQSHEPELQLNYQPAATTTTSTTTTTTAPSGTCGSFTAPPEYGAGSTGPGNEPRTTTGTQATTSTYTSVLAAATPGTTVLLRAGSYGALNVPAGVTVKPYDCETVTASSFDLHSGSTVAGFNVSSSDQWVDRIDGRSSAITNVTVRNMKLRQDASSNTEVLRVEEDVDGFTITGNDVATEADNHVIKVMDDETELPGGGGTPDTVMPRNGLIANNRIARPSLANCSPCEDGIQLEGTSLNVVIEHNSFGLQGEEMLDVKDPSAGVVVRNNDLDNDGTFTNADGTQSGDLTPNGGQALITTTRTLQFLHNKVQGTDCFLEVGGYSIQTDPVLADNTILGCEVLLRSSDGVDYKNNTHTGGILGLGTTTSGDQPTTLEITGNTFTGPLTLKVNTGSTYTCDGNTFVGTAEDFPQEGTLTCTNQPVPA